MNFKPLTVDGVAYEWFAAGATRLNTSNGEILSEESAIVIVARRAGSAAPGFPLHWEGPNPPEEADVAEIIRRHPDKFAGRDEPRHAANRHAMKLRASWYKLPLAERIELARVWLARWEKISGHPPAIKDASDLQEISAQAVIAAHARSTSHADEERAAQERDVQAALDRNPS